MKSSGFAAAAVLAAVAGVAISSCGGSSSSPSPSGAAAVQTTAPPITVPGGSFCTQAVGFAAQLAAVSHGFSSVSPGATPSVTAFKQLIAAADSAIDSLDSSAPSAIATSFHTLRTAYDQANAQVQSVTSFQQLSTAFASFSAPAVKDAGTAITSYMQTTCGIVSPSP
jgi:hypothetical protein